MKKDLLQYCVGQSLSLTRESKLKLHMLSLHHNCTPSKIINSLLSEVDGPPEWESTLQQLKGRLELANSRHRLEQIAMQRFLRDIDLKKTKKKDI